MRSSSQSAMQPAKKVYKRQYLRSGCIECKRRKIKCNEAKPSCANCTRVELQCLYPAPNHRNKIRKRPHSDMLPLQPLPSPLPPPAQSALLDFDMSVFENIFDDANTLIHGVVDYENQIVDPTTLFQELHLDLKPFHSNIILNEIPGHMQDKKHYLFLDENELQSYLKDPSLDFYTAPVREQPPAEEKASNKELVDLIVAKFKLSDDEVHYFRDFALGPGAAYFFPFVEKREENPVMKVLLEYCQYLKYMVYAMMAVSALMKFLHTRDDADDVCQRRFTAICMRLLVHAFTDLQNNVLSLWNVEGLILTILLRTMLFSDMTVVDTLWILHLNEAKTLLIKYSLLKAQTLLYKPDLPGITIAKQLFFCYDWSSRISSDTAAGETGDFASTESGPLQASKDALMQLQVFLPAQNGDWFNLFTGLTAALEHVIHEFHRVRAQLHAAAGEAQAPPESVCRLMALLDSALQQSVVPGISEDFLIQLDNPAHPLYPDMARRIVLPSSAYGIDTKSGQYYSWCDAAMLSHVHFLYLQLLTTRGLLYLPRSHPLIKSVVRKIVALMFFIRKSPENEYYLCDSSFDYRAIMIQLPLRLCIALTDEEDHFHKLELFFRGMVRLGCGNCTLPLAEIQKNREAARKRREQAAKGIRDENECNYRADIYFY